MKVRIAPDQIGVRGQYSRRQVVVTSLVTVALAGASWWFGSRSHPDPYANEHAKLYGDLSATATASSHHLVAGNAEAMLSTEALHTILGTVGLVLFVYGDPTTASGGSGRVVRLANGRLGIETAGHVVTDEGSQGLEQITSLLFGLPGSRNGFARFTRTHLDIRMPAGRKEGSVADDLAVVALTADGMPEWLARAPVIPATSSAELYRGQAVVAAGVPVEFMPDIITDDSLQSAKLYVNTASVSQPPENGVLQLRPLEVDSAMSGGPVMVMSAAGQLATAAVVTATYRPDRYTAYAATLKHEQQLLGSGN